VGQAFQPADSLSSESSRPEGRLAATIGHPTQMQNDGIGKNERPRTNNLPHKKFYMSPLR